MSRMQPSSYDIERTTGQCAMTERPIEPGTAYMATLIEEGEELKRVDVSLEAWEAGNRPKAIFSFWRAVVPMPNEKRRVFVDDEVLMNLLRRLEDATQPQRIAFRFVLMLILMRKKLLRYDATENREGDGGETESWWKLTPKLDLSKGPLGKWSDSETIEVLDPHLNDEQVIAVTEQLGEILNAEL